MVLVKIMTDVGIEGIGQFIAFSKKSQIKYLHNTLKPLLVNKNPLDIDKLWNDMYWKGQGKNGWIQTIAAIDIALHDILGKFKGQPLWKIFGAKENRLINLYWSMGHGYKKTNKEMLQLIEKGWSLGFRAFKIRMDWHEYNQDVNPKKDLRMAKEVRRFLPESIPLAFDANAGYSVDTAILQGKNLLDLNISYFEEPIATNDLYGLKTVVENTTIPISFGEYEKTSWRFKEVIEISNVDIVQPDILNIGGLSELKKLYDLSNYYNKIILPHSPDVGLLSIASLHIFNLIDENFYHEYSDELCNYNQNIVQDYFMEPILPTKGRIKLNNKPGLGVTVNQELLLNNELK